MPHPALPELSFEFFPPSSTSATLRLWRAVERLSPLGPKFVSVTYGAGGTTRDRTFAAIMTILDRVRIDVAGHLTCVGATREDTLAVADKYRAMGVSRIVALRGDPPAGQDNFTAHRDGFSSGLELVRALTDRGIAVSVPAYPETHPEARDLDADIDTLKAKQDAGADRALTQFFFENETFLRFRDRAVARGVTIPIIPGILPIENFEKMRGFAQRCGADVPDWMVQAYRNAQTQEDAELLSTAICSEQCDELRTEGVAHLHFYTLNNPDLTFNICRAIGIETAPLGIATGTNVA